MASDVAASRASIAKCVRQGLAQVGVSEDAVQLVETTDRAAVGHLLKLEGKIDLAIPRRGESLIRAVVEQAHIPVIKHYTGNCHVYVDATCEQQMAIDICVNAKTHRTGVCNATETILFHKDTVASGLMQKICAALKEKNVELRCDAASCNNFADTTPATDEDWATEYLDLICAIRVVDTIDDAIFSQFQHLIIKYHCLARCCK